jgi:DNA-directed RNA polymerase subunit RPC12/RpoP
MNRAHAFMNALSAWTVALRCPHCGRTGLGTVSEDGQKVPSLRVDGLSTGFITVELRPGAGPDIRCATCNSSALK